MGLLGFMEDPDAQHDVRQRSIDMMGAAGDGQFWQDTFDNGMDTLNGDIIGGLLGAPVDAIGGLLGVDDPVMGQQWIEAQMRRAGMVR